MDAGKQFMCTGKRMMSTGKQFMNTGKQLMDTGKLVKSHTSAGTSYVLILRLKEGMTVPANIFLEKKAL
jgi:hypothetical protein